MRWWTGLSAITDLVLALILIVGIPIAALVLGLFGATPQLVASFAWILALSFIADGLMLLEVAGARATFFTLGWIAERYPAMVRRIVDQGHELASHGYGHQRASDLDEPAFFDDVDRAKRLLEDIGGQAVLGYRAPSFSIGDKNLWALDVLLRAGYRYSSSIYPVRHDHYGSPDAPRFAHEVRPGLLEVPPTTLRLFDRNLPSSGGGFFRLLPYPLSRWMLQQVNRRDGEAAVFYFHPWEIDPEQPRVPGIDFKTRFRHYLNIAHTEQRLARLLGDFAWGRMDQIFLGAATRARGPGG